MEKAGVISSYFIWALLMALHSIQKGAWHQRAMATMWFNNLTWPTRPSFDCILQESQESQEASCLWHGRLKAEQEAAQTYPLHANCVCYPECLWMKARDLLENWCPKVPQCHCNETQEEQRSFWIERFHKNYAINHQLKRLAVALHQSLEVHDLFRPDFQTWFGQPWPYQDFQSFGSKDACLFKHLTSSDTSLLTCISDIPGS